MIHDWITIPPRPDSTGPIGDPFLARQTYLATFQVLEEYALMRCTETELAHWEGLGFFGIAAAARIERQRREAL